MTSLSYDEIFSRFFSRVEAYDFLDLSPEQSTDYLNAWLHGACSKPFLRRLFSSIVYDDEIEELTFSMKYSVDDFSDKDFVIEVISLGIAIEWLEPKVNSIMNLSQMFASKEEKFYSQANHLMELKNSLNYFRKTQRQIIVDRGFAWNSYLGGDNL